ncbi:MAG: N-acetyltransferase DgcN [Xanthomonadales bacterium]|nr:N-acetyltransferase DgcN [Xanthomonadales bacterium]
MQNTLTQVQLAAPYLILIGQQDDPTYAKTGFGIVQWRPELVTGQLRFPGCDVDMGVPDMTVAQAVAAGARSLVIGVAPVGGSIPDSWWEIIEQAAQAGMDIVSGLHIKLNDRASLVNIAKASGARLVDVRTPPKNLPVGNGKKRSGRRVLMVGTDCAIGKKYTALALHQSMIDAGMNATFRATGQTGIMIAGEGVPIDAVIADFISGAAEVLTPDNAADHWDVIEGQGSLFHPGYSGVSLGLLHGSQPDAFVLCHDATRTTVSGFEHFLLPSITECIDLHVRAGKRTNPNIRCVGISVNTSALQGAARTDYLARLQNEHGLPCVDPLIDGCDAIVTHIRQTFGD